MGWETAEGRITFWGKDCDIEGGWGVSHPGWERPCTRSKDAVSRTAGGDRSADTAAASVVVRVYGALVIGREQVRINLTHVHKGEINVTSHPKRYLLWPGVRKKHRLAKRRS